MQTTGSSSSFAPLAQTERSVSTLCNVNTDTVIALSPSGLDTSKVGNSWQIVLACCLTALPQMFMACGKPSRDLSTIFPGYGIRGMWLASLLDCAQSARRYVLPK